MVSNILKEALDAGVQLFVQNGKLNFAAPKGSLSAELRAKIVAHKQEMIELLASLGGGNAGEASSAALQPVAERGALPLSFAQQRLWFVDQLEGGSHQYNVASALRLTGRLNLDALRRAFDEIVARHEVLRTVYRSEGGEGWQTPRAPRPVVIERIDLSDLVGEEQGRRVHEMARAEAETPFDLTGDQLLRLRLLEIGEDEAVLLFTMHHIASDGWSIGLLVRELTLLYTAFCRGEESPLPPLSIQYADFAHWQRNALAGVELERQVGWWKETLDGIPRLHSLPLDKPRPPRQQFAGRRHHRALSHETLEELRRLAQAHGVTLFVLLQSALSLLIGRWSNESDVVIGSPVAGRLHKDVEPLIGCFVNTLALRTQLDPSLTFEQLLARSKETIVGAFSHQQVPFEMLVDALRPERSLSHAPLFQILLVLQNTERFALELPGLAISEVPSSESVIRYDLELACEEGDHGLSLTWSYAGSLFEAATIERLAASFEVLLASILSAPQTAIGKLAIVEESDLRAYEAWNVTAASFPREMCVHELFEQQARETPHAVAVELGTARLTYSQLNEKANRLADYLREWGLGADSLIGLCMERSLEMVVSVLGILKAGAAYLPLEPSYPRERIEYVIADASLDVVLVQSSVIDRLPLSGVDVVLVDDVVSDDFMEDYSAADAAPAITPENLCYVIYTSGSTGRPKGVMIHHRGVVNYLSHATAEYFDTKHAGAVMSSPLGFDATVTTLLAPLVSGRRLVLLPESQEEMLAGLTHYLFESDETWLFKLTPAHLEMLADRDRSGGGEHMLVVGGEQLSVSTLAKWKGHFLPRATFINEYGPTETVVGCSIYRVRSAEDVVLPHCASAVSIGKPIRNTSLHVLGEQLERVPAGAIGELYIGGEGVARGYLNRPELTVERFVEIGGKRLYKTGDLVRWLPHGNLVFLGRCDDQVKIRGFRIELGEIAAQLARHPNVKESLVVVTDGSLVAYVAPSSPVDDAVLAGALRQSLSRALPEYMLPSAIVVLEAFPLTGNGKIDRKALPAPDRLAHQAYVAPSTPTEARLAEIWRELLKLDGAVSVTANFFDLGGHSLLATRLLSRIAGELHAAVSLRALFEHPTLRAFAAHVDGLARVALVPLVPVPRGGAMPPSFAQQRLWFIDQLEQGSAQYNMPSALLMEGPLDRAALQVALDAIVARHEVLRTRFVAHGDGCVQEIGAPEPVPMRVIEVANRAALEQLARDEATRLFDLRRDLMLRATLVRLAEEEHALLLTLHHIAADGWSLSILVNELGALYAGEVLAPLRIQYADYAHWQRAQGFERQLDYWKSQLAGIPAVHSVPLDKPRPAQQSFGGANLRRHLDRAAYKRLLGVAEQQGSTLFMLLETAFALLLSRWSQASDIVIGSPIAGRTHEDVEPLIGFFVNTLVLRTKIAPARPFVELLQQNKQTILDAFAHQDVSFDALVGELRPARSLSYSPLFQIFFALQNNDDAHLELPGLAVRELRGGNAAIRYDLQLAAKEDGDGLLLSWSWAESLFDARTIERMAASFEVLLAAIVDDPRAAIDRLPLLTASDREQIEQWNDTAAEVPAGLCVHELFEAQVARMPDAVAVVAGERRLTYRELNAAANRLAHALVERGAAAGTLVGISLEPCVEMIVGLLAILKSGAAYVPLSLSLPVARREAMLTDGNVEIVLTRDVIAGSSLEPRSNENLPQVSPASLAYVIYTSGTTGQPKGVMISHAAAVNFTAGFFRRLGLPRAGDWLLLTSITFDIAFFEWLGCLQGGGTCHIAGETAQSDAAELRRFIESRRFQLIQTTPSRWSQLLDAGWKGQSDLVALCGGEALPLALQQRLSTSVGVLWNCYGPTEATVWSLVRKVEAGQQHVTLGTGLPNYRHHVLSANNEPLPVGAIGELHIGGPSLARGYLNRPELSAAKFIETPFGRLYKTGDLARHLPDGSLAFLGRTDDQVKIRGHRIEPAEIEAQLRRVAGVREAVVVARGDILVAYVVSDGAADLRDALRTSLPEYMIPAAFVRLETLPLNANGKVDKKALPQPELQAQQTYDAPRGDAEEHIAVIWQEVLKLDAPVSATANFFDLGGHSLIATRIAAAVGEAFGKSLPVRALFEHNTVRALAAWLEQQDQSAWQAIPVVPRNEPLPLSFAQQRLWFIDRLAEGSAQYNMPAALRLRGTLERSALQAAFDAIVARHEVLRTRFAGDVQEIGEPEPVPMPVIDVANSEEALRLAREEAARPFDLERDLMLRVKLLRLAGDEHVLLLTMHHVASDAWSVGVLIDEIAALYQGRPLAPLPIQYADFAHWQRARGFKPQLAYWKTQLAELPVVHSLPLDKPRPARQQFDGDTVLRQLDGALAKKLEALAHGHQATLFMVLQSAFALLLGRWSRSDDVAIGTPIAGREHRALDRLIGFFVNTLVLRTRLSGTESFHALLERAKQTALDAYANQAVPFETLVDELKPERSLAHGALFQVLFSLQHRERGLLELPGIEISSHGVDFDLTKFDLNLTATERDEHLQLRWQYATSLFERETIERMAESFGVLLEAIVATPEAAIDTLPLLADPAAMLAQSRGETSTVGRDEYVHRLFEAQAVRTPEAPAVRFGSELLTYRELNERANRFAHALAGRGERIGLYSERSPEVLVGMLAILKAGATYVPFEPSNTAERLRHIIANGQIECVLVQSKLIENLPGGLDLVLLDETQDAPAHNPDLTPAESAYVMYTSGSTGVPKGVEILHRGFIDYCAFASENYYSEHLTGSLVVTSHGFDITVPSLYVPLMRGGCVHLGPNDEEVGDYLIRMTPMHVASMLPEEVRPNRHVFVIGGEAFPATLARELQGRFPNAQIYNHYGPTETVVGCAMFDVTANLERERLPIGRPMANHELYVLSEALQVNPIGVAGELHIGGAGVATGYVNQPELTAEKFIPNPFGEGRLYKSGDLVRYLPEGNLEFLGRVDHQVKIRGYRIEPGEIESVIKQTAKDALVIAQGEGEHKALVAYVICDDLAEVKARVKSALPDYMVPSAWCALEAFPLNANGKIDRKALPAIDRKPLGEYVPPRSETEERLVETWQRVLGIRTPLSVTANFFELGGHSLLATRLSSQISDTFRCRVPIQAFFEYQDVRALADFIDGVQLLSSSAVADPTAHYEDEGTL